MVFRTALYHRFYLFPKQARAWDDLRAKRIAVTLDDGWNEYRGACHNHSELSHDCEVTFPQVLQAAKEAGLDFIFMADHCIDGKADYSLGWKGDHDGVLFVQGFEMAQGFMPWGLPNDTILDNNQDPRERAKRIHELGGLLFFAHPEEERLWDLPELTGMEIYNIHADFEEGLVALLPDLTLNLRAYPDQTLRLIFDRQNDILARWDELNKSRKIVGIAANDAHQNNGLRGYYTAKNTFLLRTTAKEDDDSVLREWPLNFFTRTALRLFPGKLEPGKQLFRVDFDPYKQSLRFVNTHLLARECTEPALLDALRQGRCFVAFDMIADARGFVYCAETAAPDGSPNRAVMGESIPLAPGLKLKAQAPHECRFRLRCDGTAVQEAEGASFEYEPVKPGKYRVEAELLILGEWTPWVYTNPIEVITVSSTEPLPEEQS